RAVSHALRLYRSLPRPANVASEPQAGIAQQAQFGLGLAIGDTRGDAGQVKLTVDQLGPDLVERVVEAHQPASNSSGERVNLECEVQGPRSSRERTPGLEPQQCFICCRRPRALRYCHSTR